MDRSSIKQFRQGTHRTVSPDETVRRLETLLVDFGITRVADVTGMDRIGIPTAMVVRPNARSVSVSHGKGATMIAATAAALMEAVELHHAERVECPLRLCSAAELRAEHRILDPARMPRVARACSLTEPILWAEGRTLDGGVVWVPLGLVQLDLRRPSALDSGHFVAGTDGLGAGDTLEEAIVHGVCEVVERDALALFYASAEPEHQRRSFDLDSVDDPVCRELLARYAGANVEMAVWDLTSDLRIPCFLCCVRDDPAFSTRPIELVTGTGCHPSRAVALARALCEAAQRRIARVVRVRDEADVLSSDLGRPGVLDLDRLAFEPAAQHSTRYLDVPTFDSASFEEDVAWLRQRFETSEVTLAVVDLSRAKYPVHVVRAVAEARASEARGLRVAAERGAA